MQSAPRAESPNIPHRWLAEEAAVLAIELSGALVADFEGRAGGVQTIHEHAFASGLQMKLFLILKRARGGERAGMMVQRRETHAREVGKISTRSGFAELALTQAIVCAE